MFSHIMIGANDIQESKIFYDAILGAMGHKPGVIDGSGRCFYITDNGIFEQTKPIACMPPPRQHRLLPEPESRLAALTPLNEGFARPLRSMTHDPCSSAHSSSASAADAATSRTAAPSGWQPPRSDGQEVLPYARGCKRIALSIAADPAQRAAAAAEFKNRIYSRTTQGPRDQKLTT